MGERLWRIQNASVCVRRRRRMAKRNGFQCGASAAATALIAEVSVAGIVTTMLPSTSVPICCTTLKVVLGRSSINISSSSSSSSSSIKMLMKPPLQYLLLGICELRLTQCLCELRLTQCCNPTHNMGLPQRWATTQGALQMQGRHYLTE